MSAEPALPVPSLSPFGLTSIVVRFAWTTSDMATRAVQNFKYAVDQSNILGIVETATALASVIISFDRAITTRAAVSQQVQQVLDGTDWTITPPPPVRRIWHIPVAFGGDYGPQLDQVAQMIGRTPDQAVAEIAQTDLRVLSIGFAPGQPYVGLLDPHWNIPRQTELTPHVPAGALVVAIRQLVLFTNPSVTGWRQVGYCAFRPFVAERTNPFALELGDLMKFQVVSHKDMAQIEATAENGLGGARCESVSPQ